MTEPNPSGGLPDWPAFGLVDDARPALARARARGVPAALVTLVAVEGGGPRPPGTQMVVADGVLSGFLSGGCVEADVVAHAHAALRNGRARRLVYGEGGPWPDIRLLCGARIELLVERVGPDDAAVGDLLDAWRARRPVLWRSDGETRDCRPARGDEATCALEGEAVVRRFDPVPRLLVVGADPTAMAIATLSVQAGFETTLVRPNGPEAPPPIAGCAYRRDDPASAFAAIGLDPWTAVAVATHEIEVDHEALLAALPSAAAYVGVLGARRRVPEREARLRAAGIGEDQLARLHAPIGLDLGGKAPWEVAVSVIAEVVAERR